MDYIADYDDADTVSIDTLALCEEFIKESERDREELRTLSKKVCNLHTNLLYYRKEKTKRGAVCYKAWESIVKSVGGSQNCWKELGHHLGIDRKDLDYINHSVHEDRTDMVLKVFLQDEQATLDKITDTFVAIKRYDILKAIEKPLCDLASCFIKNESKSDLGYETNSNDSSYREIISIKTDISEELPLVLRKNGIHGEKNPNRPQFPTKKPAPILQQEVNEGTPTLLLTYAEDGIETALNIQDQVNCWPEDVVMIILNDKKEQVLQNPEKFIREHFEKALYVVPIITPGYLNKIQNSTPALPSTSDNIDCSYVNFLYSLISNHYMFVSGCLNKKVRSVLPKNGDVSVLTRLPMYPDLMPWTHELQFEEQFKSFLRTYQQPSITMSVIYTNK